MTIKKVALLKAIKDNRTKHEKEYNEAVRGYRLKVQIAAKQLVADAQDSHAVIDRNPIIQMVTPASHIKDYDRIIKMLEMSTATNITISESQFQQYVMDEWAWSNQFKAVSSTYNAAHR